jgi:hypothetical protein
LEDIDFSHSLGPKSDAYHASNTKEAKRECARRGWGEEGPGDTLLTKWYTGSYRDIASAKRGHMHVDWFEDILEELTPHFDCVKPFCRELRAILLSYSILNTQDVSLIVRTPKDPEILHGPIMKAFGKAIDDIKATE